MLNNYNVIARLPMMQAHADTAAAYVKVLVRSVLCMATAHVIFILQLNEFVASILEDQQSIVVQSDEKNIKNKNTVRHRR